MGWPKKQHKKLAVEFALEKAVDYHEAFGTTPAVYNEDEDRIEELPASAYVIMILLHSKCSKVPLLVLIRLRLTFMSRSLL